jgi:hypothetical protein
MDFVGDNCTVVDGRTLEVIEPAGGALGFWQSSFLSMRANAPDWLIRSNFANRAIDSFRLSQPGNPRTCIPESAFVVARRSNRSDSLLELFGIDLKGAAWRTTLKSPNQGALGLFQADSFILVCRANDIHVLSARDGRVLWQEYAPEENWETERVIFCRSGFAVQGVAADYRWEAIHHNSGFCKSGGNYPKLRPKFGRSLQFRDWRGSKRFERTLEDQWYMPAIVPSANAAKWGGRFDGGTFKLDFCRPVSVDAQALAVTRQERILLLSTVDGSTLTSVAFDRGREYVAHDRIGFYVSSDSGFRGYTYDGTRLTVPDAPRLRFPVRGPSGIAFYSGDYLFTPRAAEQIAARFHGN